MSLRNYVKVAKRKLFPFTGTVTWLQIPDVCRPDMYSIVYECARAHSQVVQRNRLILMLLTRVAEEIEMSKQRRPVSGLRRLRRAVEHLNFDEVQMTDSDGQFDSSTRVSFTDFRRTVSSAVRALQGTPVKDLDNEESGPLSTRSRSRNRWSFGEGDSGALSGEEEEEEEIAGSSVVSVAGSENHAQESGWGIGWDLDRSGSPADLSSSPLGGIHGRPSSRDSGSASGNRRGYLSLAAGGPGPWGPNAKPNGKSSPQQLSMSPAAAFASVLHALADLRGVGYAEVSLEARQMLIVARQPSLQERRAAIEALLLASFLKRGKHMQLDSGSEQMEETLGKALPPGVPVAGTRKLENLSPDFSSGRKSSKLRYNKSDQGQIFAKLPDPVVALVDMQEVVTDQLLTFFSDKRAALRCTALEVYIRRLYRAYNIVDLKLHPGKIGASEAKEGDVPFLSAHWMFNAAGTSSAFEFPTSESSKPTTGSFHAVEGKAKGLVKPIGRSNAFNSWHMSSMDSVDNLAALAHKSGKESELARTRPSPLGVGFQSRHSTHLPAALEHVESPDSDSAVPELGRRTSTPGSDHPNIPRFDPTTVSEEEAGIWDPAIGPGRDRFGCAGVFQNIGEMQKNFRNLIQHIRAKNSPANSASSPDAGDDDDQSLEHLIHVVHLVLLSSDGLADVAQSPTPTEVYPKEGHNGETEAIHGLSTFLR